MTVAGRTVLLAGATSPSGLAIARALRSAGARVVAVGRDQVKLDALAAALPDSRVVRVPGDHLAALHAPEFRAAAAGFLAED